MGKLLLSQQLPQPWLNIPLLEYDVGGKAVLRPVAQLSGVPTRWHRWPASSPAARLFLDSLRRGLKCIPLHQVESWGTHRFKLCEHYSGMGDVGFEQHVLQTRLVLNTANYFTTVGSHKLTGREVWYIFFEFWILKTLKKIRTAPKTTVNTTNFAAAFWSFKNHPQNHGTLNSFTVGKAESCQWFQWPAQDQHLRWQTVSWHPNAEFPVLSSLHKGWGQGNFRLPASNSSFHFK